MKITGSPFAIIDGQPHLIINFALDVAFGASPLVDDFTDVLREAYGQDILLLRRLSPAEADLLAEQTLAAEYEAWPEIAARVPNRKE